MFAKNGDLGTAQVTSGDFLAPASWSELRIGSTTALPTVNPSPQGKRKPLWAMPTRVSGLHAPATSRCRAPTKASSSRRGSCKPFLIAFLVATRGSPCCFGTTTCKAVGIENNREVASKLKVDEKDGVDIADAIGRKQRTTIVNRPGLTKVLRYSTKPEAKARRACALRGLPCLSIYSANRKFGSLIETGNSAINVRILSSTSPWRLSDSSAARRLFDHALSSPFTGRRNGEENVVRKADHRTHLAVLVHILAAFKTEGGRNSQIFPHSGGRESQRREPSNGGGP
jgi:hypothetical protein